MKPARNFFFLSLAAVVLLIPACKPSAEKQVPAAETAPLRGASSYTPYDGVAMIWAREDEDRTMAWVSSGGEAGRLLVAGAAGERRPDWVLCTQGVVAGLAARGEDVRIIASVYVSDDVLLPVFRSPRSDVAGSRSLFIPRSSIEFAFDRLLQREGVAPSEVRVPTIESTGFATITSLLEKPVSDTDAIDFAILVEPFITNVVSHRPDAYEVGAGGLYEMHYSVVVRASDLRDHRNRYVSLIRQLVEASTKIEQIQTDDEFYESVWGRRADGSPDRLSPLRTFSRAPLRVSLAPDRVRDLLREEIEYLATKYPGELRVPASYDELVDPSLLVEVAPERVKE